MANIPFDNIPEVPTMVATRGTKVFEQGKEIQVGNETITSLQEQIGKLTSMVNRLTQERNAMVASMQQNHNQIQGVWGEVVKLKQQSGVA